MSEAYKNMVDRNLGLLTEEEQERLRRRAGGGNQ